MIEGDPRGLHAVHQHYQLPTRQYFSSNQQALDSQYYNQQDQSLSPHIVYNPDQNRVQMPQVARQNHFEQLDLIKEQEVKEDREVGSGEEPLPRYRFNRSSWRRLNRGRKAGGQ